MREAMGEGPRRERRELEGVMTAARREARGRYEQLVRRLAEHCRPRDPRVKAARRVELSRDEGGASGPTRTVDSSNDSSTVRGSSAHAKIVTKPRHQYCTHAQKPTELRKAPLTRFQRPRSRLSEGLSRALFFFIDEPFRASTPLCTRVVCG